MKQETSRFTNEEASYWIMWSFTLGFLAAGFLTVVCVIARNMITP
jgi:hypothetical protein